MRDSDFTADSHGRLLRTAQGYNAYVPHPLPPLLAPTWELAGQLSAADRAASELAGAARVLPNPHLLIGPFLRREAVLSSRIEGTQASLSDLFFFEAVGESGAEADDVREVANYVNALEYGLRRLQEFPLSLRLIRELHEQLMSGVRGEYSTPGEFRRSQNWIGPPGCTLMDATYVPPPVPEMHEALDAFEKYLYAEPRLPPLVQLALVHYQFEAIHPFLDGNGRIGRLLLTLLMVRQGLLPQPLLYLSAFFERYREDYYRLLLAVSQRGAWDEWVTFFLRGVTTQSGDAVARSNKLLDLWQSYRREFQSSKSPGALLKLLDTLIEYPVITLGGAAKILGVTFRAAGQNVDKLVRAGVLRETTGRARNRVFIAPQIISILESPEISTGQE